MYANAYRVARGRGGPCKAAKQRVNVDLMTRTQINDQEKRPSLEVKAGTSARRESREIRENKQFGG